MLHSMNLTVEIPKQGRKKYGKKKKINMMHRSLIERY